MLKCIFSKFEENSEESLYIGSWSKILKTVWSVFFLFFFFFFLVCGLCIAYRGSFSCRLGVTGITGKLCSVIMAILGHILYYLLSHLYVVGTVWYCDRLIRIALLFVVLLHTILSIIC